MSLVVTIAIIIPRSETQQEDEKATETANWFWTLREDANLEKLVKKGEQERREGAKVEKKWFPIPNPLDIFSFVIDQLNQPYGPCDDCDN